MPGGGRENDKNGVAPLELAGRTTRQETTRKEEEKKRVDVDDEKKKKKKRGRGNEPEEMKSRRG